MKQEKYTHISDRSRTFLDELSSATPMQLRTAQDAPLGLYDQEGLYPHVIAEWNWSRVAVPLGGQYDARWDMYEVAPFTFQQIPQPEYELGWSIPIKKVRLLKKDPDAERHGPNLGSIRVRADGSLDLYCFSYRGFTDTVTIPGCKSRKRPWIWYNVWEMIVSDTDGGSRIAVRYDGDSETYQHWPDVCAEGTLERV
jgi:hypothetical protein